MLKSLLLLTTNVISGASGDAITPAGRRRGREALRAEGGAEAYMGGTTPNLPTNIIPTNST